MSKRITVTLYEFPELTGAARERAARVIEQRLYESLSEFAAESDWSFCDAVPGDETPVTWAQLPEGDCIQGAFRDEYRFHGARQGRYIRAAFFRFVTRLTDEYIVTDEEIEDEAEAAELLFHADGRLFED